MSKIDTSTEAPVTLTYTNWKGETAQRRIIPRRIWWGSTEWHPEPQWLLTALDVDKQADRDFALKDFGQPITVQDAANVPEVQALIRQAVEAEREACARLVDCGCDAAKKAAVLRADNGTERARACGEYACGADDAAAIRKRTEGKA